MKFLSVIKSVCITIILISLQSCSLFVTESDIRSKVREGNFTKAYELLDKYKYADDWDKANLRVYIASQEAIYLLAEGDYNRIKYLYQQTLTELGNRSDYINEFNKVIVNHAIIEDNSEFLLEYLPINQYYNEELLNYLIKKNERAFNDYIYIAISKTVEKEIEPTVRTDRTLPLLNQRYFVSDVDNYHRYASSVNIYLISKVTEALSSGNTEIAKRLLNLFKKNVECKAAPIVTEGDKYYPKCIVTGIIQTVDELEARKKVRQANEGSESYTEVLFENNNTNNTANIEDVILGLSGKIGQYPITMFIYTNGGDDNFGYYYYNSRPDSKFTLKCVQNNPHNGYNDLVLEEYTENGKNTGIFKGRLKGQGGGFIGKFTNSKNKTFNVNLSVKNA